MDKASYSLSAIAQCKELIRKAHWSTRLKAEHKSRCAEVNTLFASCQTLLNCILFQPDLSPAYDYQQMVAIFGRGLFICPVIVVMLFA